jgi:hypothetical protein
MPVMKRERLGAYERLRGANSCTELRAESSLFVSLKCLVLPPVFSATNHLGPTMYYPQSMVLQQAQQEASAGASNGLTD